jgi:hypothetical protein
MNLFAVVISIVAADFFFALPEFDFSITEGRTSSASP